MQSQGHTQREDFPPANGLAFQTLYHGTAVPFETFHDPASDRDGTTRLGCGFDHQGPAIYLTDDANGFARFFARTATAPLGCRMILSGQKAEGNAMIDSDGFVLSVSLLPEARILDLASAPAEIVKTFPSDVMIRSQGIAFRQAVLDAGYDGAVFTEPNCPDGWELAQQARTVVLYRHHLAKITGSAPAASYDLAKGWSERNHTAVSP